MSPIHPLLRPPQPPAVIFANLPPMALVFPGVKGASSWSLNLPATESHLTVDITPGAASGGYCPGIEQESTPALRPTS